VVRHFYSDSFPAAQQLFPFRRPKHPKTLAELTAEREMLKAKRATETKPIQQVALDISIENCERQIAKTQEA
jgi:hypothetical protein